jgi:hypothetical protein
MRADHSPSPPARSGTGRFAPMAGSSSPSPRQSIRSARLALIGLVTGLGLLLAACSSSPSSSSNTTSTSSSSSTSSSTSTSTTAGLANCSTSELQLSAGQSNGAAGTIGQIILFKNTATSSCLLHGFPGVAGLDSGGNQVAQATRVVNLAPFTGPTSSLPTVTLAPGDTASALVFGSDVPTGAATSCATYAALLVTPPNALQSVQVAATLPGCAGLRVGPVYSGTTGMSS